MKPIDMSRFVREMKTVVERHYLGNGEYARWIWQNTDRPRRLGVNEYGCADAANILYSIDEFVCSDEERAMRIAALQALQDPETGMFTEETHHTIHTTAHCTGALELFNVRPLHPIKGLHKYLDKDELYGLIDNLDWYINPWSQSHLGAGVYAALVNAGEATPEFCENYFAWFRENADPVTGFWKPGYSDKSPWTTDDFSATGAPRYYFMAGGFHYLFNHEHAHQPMPYPERVIDTCLEMYERDALNGHFCKMIGFLEVDWLYCVNRALRQRPTYRTEECISAMEDFAVKLCEYLNSLNTETHDGVNDLHALFGTVCALAELQAALPGKIITDKPMRLVLDRRPFI